MTHKRLTAGVLITLGILISCIFGGCADDEVPTEYGEIKLLATVPEEGATILVTEELQVVFDGFPGTVTINGKEAKIMEDNTVTMRIADLPNAGTGPEKTVIISWTNLDNSFFGTQTLSFTAIKHATTVEVDPSPGSSILSYTKFTLIFDQEVVVVTVNDAPAVGSGRSWKASPALWAGAGQTLKIRWVNRDGSTNSREIGPYDIYDNGGEPPEITSATVNDGDADVDPAFINTRGFRFDFNELVTGNIALTDEAGANLNWIANVAGQTATLTPVAGQELVNGTTYKIEINVKDGSGNQLKATITFVTKPK